MLNGHGDDIHAFPNIRFNFSSNVYYHGCDETLIEALQEDLVSRISNYPSPTAEELSTRAALFHGCSEDSILFFNGATEGFYTIAHCFKGTSATVFGPTFSEYEDACVAHDLNIRWKERSTFNDAVISDPLAFLCNPNNPDGSVTDRPAIEAFLDRNPDTYLVLDEAYIEFTLSVASMIDLCSKYERLIVVRSLTKVFAIPGLRLGYVVGAPSIIERLKAKKMPWSVNGLAIRAGEHIFEHYEALHFSKEQLLAEMETFKKQLSTVDFLRLLPTNTTYLLAELKKATASELKSFLALSHDVLVRDATNFTGLEGEYIRLSLQSPEVNQELIKALKKW